MFPLREPDADLTADSGRRARRKAETRAALNDAALRLFATRGYEQTSVDDLCRAADVSLRTFFRYFDSKDDVLFARDMDATPFLTSLRAAPDHLAPLAAIGHAYLEQPRLSARDVQQAQLFHRAMSDSAVLQGRYVAGIERFRDEVAGVLARRAGRRVPNDVDHLAATLGQSTLDHAYRRWLARDGRGDLRTIVRQAFDALETLVGGDHRLART
jgi:AcrR family transcriptional regulator